MATLTNWEQRVLDTTGHLPPRPDTRQGQAALTTERQRYIVMPGVRGHKTYRLWDTQLNTLVSEGDSLQAVRLAAWTLNTMPGA